MTNTQYKIGTRVRCVGTPQTGVGFPGLLGTVTEFHDYDTIYVRWDNPPSADVNPTGPSHGGSWGSADLQIVDNEEVDRLREELREAHTIMAEAAGRLERAEDIEEALHARLTEMAHKLEEASRDRDDLGAVLLYALEGLDAEARQRVFGFWDAVFSA